MTLTPLMSAWLCLLLPLTGVWVAWGAGFSRLVSVIITLFWLMLAYDDAQLGRFDPILQQLPDTDIHIHLGAR